jgi:glutathione S-transferase
LLKNHQETLPQLHQPSQPVLEGGSAIVEYLTQSEFMTSSLHQQLWCSDSSVDEAQVRQWLAYAAQTCRPAMVSGDQGLQKGFAKFLNDHLETRPFLVRAHGLTVADLVVFASVYPYVVGSF